MPRKNARPAAKKEAERRKARMAAKSSPKPRVGTIANLGHSGVALALLASAMFRRIDRRD